MYKSEILDRATGLVEGALARGKKLELDDLQGPSSSKPLHDSMT